METEAFITGFPYHPQDPDSISEPLFFIQPTETCTSTPEFHYPLLSDILNEDPSLDLIDAYSYSSPWSSAPTLDPLFGGPACDLNELYLGSDFCGIPPPDLLGPLMPLSTMADESNLASGFDCGQMSPRHIVSPSIASPSESIVAASQRRGRRRNHNMNFERGFLSSYTSPMAANVIAATMKESLPLTDTLMDETSHSEVAHAPSCVLLKTPAILHIILDIVYRRVEFVLVDREDPYHPELTSWQSYQVPANNCITERTRQLEPRRELTTQPTANCNARNIKFTKNTQSMGTKKTSFEIRSRRCRPFTRTAWSLGSAACGGRIVGVC